MSMKEFVRRSEIRSKENINILYRDIDFLYRQLDFLNDLLNRYSNKKSGVTLKSYERQDEMTRIREQIPHVYNDINYYKECINAERRELKRIYDMYGFGPTYRPWYEKDTNTKYNDYDEIKDEYNQTNNTYDEYDEYDDYSDNEPDMQHIAVEEEAEEIKEYKYNPVTDMWE